MLELVTDVQIKTEVNRMYQVWEVMEVVGGEVRD